MAKKFTDGTRLFTSYLEDVLDPQNYTKTVADMAAVIRNKFPNAEAVAFRGASGTLIAMGVCVATGLRPMMIRKEDDGSHSDHTVEGMHADKFVIVDDLVSSGGTVRNMMSTVHEHYDGGAYECLGVLTYTNNFNEGDHIDVVRQQDGPPVLVYGTRGAADFYNQ